MSYIDKDVVSNNIVRNGYKLQIVYEFGIFTEIWFNDIRNAIYSLKPNDIDNKICFELLDPFLCLNKRDFLSSVCTPIERIVDLKNTSVWAVLKLLWMPQKGQWICSKQIVFFRNYGM